MLTLILMCELLRPSGYPAFRDDADGVDHRTVIGRSIPYSGMVVKKTEKTILVQKRGQAPREFLLSECLAAGSVPADATGSDRYAIGDVMVGDLVVVTYGTFPQGSVCRSVSIHRRPGGRVPPAVTGAVIVAALRESPLRKIEMERVSVRASVRDVEL